MTVVRPAREEDLDAIARFEVEIARVSFGDAAILDQEFHRNRVRKALGGEREGLFVAVRDDDEEPRGWVWISLRTNFLTQEPYGNLRSLAVAEDAEGSDVGAALVEAALDFVHPFGVAEVSGRVHVSNLPMRTLYRRLGFEAEHLTMRKKIAR